MCYYLQEETNDTLTKNVYAEDKVPVQNTPGNSLTGSTVNNAVITNPNPVTADAVNNAPKFKPLSYGTIDKNTITPKPENEVTSTTASDIRERVKSALNSATDIKTTSFFNTFDDIDDETIKRNAPVAEETVKNNISLGILPENAKEKYPYLLDGLTLFYAASEKGNNKEAKQARNVAYLTGPKLYPIGTTQNQGYYRRKNRNNNIIRTKSASIHFEANELNYIPKDNEYSASNINSQKDIVKNENCINYDTTSNVYTGVAVEMINDTFEDLGYSDYSKDEIINHLGINKKDFIEDEDTLIKEWKTLAKLSSTGDMQKVLLDMIDHFTDGTGTDYSNEVLTKKVSEHKVTKKFVYGFTDVFNEYVKLCNGDIRAFANSKSFKDALKGEDLYLSKYNYEGFDTFTGLTLAIHGWTICEVDVTKFDLKPDGTYTGNLEFTFIDDFGLDSKDKDDFWGLDGFKCWFILQHYDKFNKKYKPFRTIVKINQPVSGKIKSKGAKQ